MKFFQLHGQINMELLDNLIEFMNENEDHEKTIIISSDGGYELTGKAITYLINCYKESCLLIANSVLSAAFNIFYQSDCKKAIMQSSMGMTHKCYNKIELNTDGKPAYTEGEAVLKNWKENYRRQDEYPFMTKQEKQSFNKGDDVYFTFNRMKEIFPEAEII